jgi:hypothetical protein
MSITWHRYILWITIVIIISIRRFFLFNWRENCEKRLLASSCLFLCPHETTRLPLNGFSLTFNIWSKFWKCTDKAEVWLKSEKTTGTLDEDVRIFMVITRSVLLRMIYVSDKISGGNYNTHFMFYSFFSESRGNVAKYGTARQATDDYIKRRMQFAYWRGYKQSEYVILTASPRQQCYPNAPHCYVTRTLPVLFSGGNVCFMRK